VWTRSSHTSPATRRRTAPRRKRPRAARAASFATSIRALARGGLGIPGIPGSVFAGMSRVRRPATLVMTDSFPVGRRPGSSRPPGVRARYQPVTGRAAGHGPGTAPGRPIGRPGRGRAATDRAGARLI
jgi:hypothetical protein